MHPLTRLQLADGMLLTLEDAVYVLGTGREGGVRRDVYIAGSTDGGEAWSDLVQIHSGPAWNSATSVVVRDGQLYRAYDTASHEADRRLSVLAGDLRSDLLAPGSWRCTNAVGFAGLPEAMKRPISPGFRDHWLEPDVVDIRERLTVIARCRIDGYGTCHLAGVCDLADSGGDLKLEFTQFHPFPGGQQKLHILYDQTSDLYWMVGSLVSDPQDHTGWYAHVRERGYKGGPGNERRILALFYSLDSLNWIQAGVVAMAKDPMQGSMYSQMLVDGDDLLLRCPHQQGRREQPRRGVGDVPSPATLPVTGPGYTPATADGRRVTSVRFRHVPNGDRGTANEGPMPTGSGGVP